jgi:hypothetical protein
MSTPGEWFDMGAAPAPAEASASLDAVKAATAAKKAGKAPQAAKVDQQTGEIRDGSGAGKTLAAFKVAIDEAGDAEVAALVLDQARDELDSTDNATLVEHFRARWEAA